MTRLARRALLLVTFSLLAWAATASAECAWVLWSELNITNMQTEGSGRSAQRRNQLRRVNY